MYVLFSEIISCFEHFLNKVFPLLLSWPQHMFCQISNNEFKFISCVHILDGMCIYSNGDDLDINQFREWFREFMMDCPDGMLTKEKVLSMLTFILPKLVLFSICFNFSSLDAHQYILKYDGTQYLNFSMIMNILND